MSPFHSGSHLESKLPNEELFRITKSQPLSSRLKFIRLRWAGHVTRMESHRFPRSILYGVLKNWDRPIGHPKLRFKDVLKRDLVDFNIPTRSWPLLASHRSSWMYILYDGMRHHHQQIDNKMRRGRCHWWMHLNFTLSSATDVCQLHVDHNIRANRKLGPK